MRAELDENGTINLSADSALEAYALRKWCEEQEGSSMTGLLINYSWPNDDD